MYYYAPDNNRKGKRAGLFALAGYIIIFVSVSLLVSFRMGEPVATSEGILIDFGSDTEGYGVENVALSEDASASSQAGGDEDNILTQEQEEAPAIRTNPAKTKNSNTPAKSDNKPSDKQSQSTAEQPREVNRKALFPGRSAASTASSQGTNPNAAGNAGNPSGGDGSSAGTGSGSEGVSFDLEGRSPVGGLPKPDYASNSQGQIVVDITVDAQGKVQTAAFRPQGSTTQDSALRAAALRAARQARFTPSEANAVQTGTITYIFRLQ